MIKKSASQPAESLIETIIAITVITLAMSAATSLTHVSLFANEVIGQKKVAEFLAQEGMDATVNIRDTNYLRYASDPNECWYVYSFTSSTYAKAENCSTSYANRIAEGTYYLTQDLNSDFFEWGLSTSSAYGSIYQYTLDSSGHKIYAQKGITGYSGYGVPTDTGYTRELVFSNKTTAADGGVASFDLTVTVSWTSSGLDKSISLTQRISNVY